jgi:S1-C subfamily serine protease
MNRQFLFFLSLLTVISLAAIFHIENKFKATVPAAGQDVRRDWTVAAIEKVMPSVVNVATARVVEYNDFYQNLLRQFYGQPGVTTQREELNSIGSGVIISDDGYLLTNVHVVRRASRVQVKLWDGRIYDAEPVVLINTHSDVAVLKLKCKPGEKFQAVQFAKADDSLLGETVVALGDPYGLGGSVSRGILSSKDRRPPAGDAPLNVENWLQTDAAINPGNSGGPLIDLRGQLIGINVAIYPEGHGIGFAIPVKQVSETLSQLFTPEITGSLWFGAQVALGSQPLAVSSVQPGSPADKAGLRVGEQILQVNGKTPHSIIEFNQLVSNTKAHDVSFVAQQNGKRADLNVKLVPFDEMIREKTGLVLAKTNSVESSSFAGQGMFIEQVELDSPAARAGLRPGILVAGIDGNDVNQLLTVAQVLSSKKSGDKVQLTIVVPQQNIPVGFRTAVTLQMR